MTPDDDGPISRPLQGHTAVISGGLGDIGWATAMELARRGADVALCDVRDDEATVLRAVRQLGVRARYHRVDVGDASAVDAWLAAIQDDLGTPSLIVPNAAIVTVARLQEVTPAQWSTELRVNLDGAFNVARSAAMRLIAKGKPGRIVFIGSWAAHVPHVHIAAYCVAKAGLRMLCWCMALEFAPLGILVNEVAPGYVDAGLSGRIWKENPGARERARTHVPTGQLIEAEDVAREVAHLCDPANRHMTGGVLLMDGGLSLVGPQRGQR